MGQFSPTDRVTVSHPNSEQGSWNVLPAGAGTITLTFSGEVLESGSNAACLGYLYWSASADGSGSHQIGSTVGPFGALSAPASYNFSTSGVPAGSYIAGGFGPNTGPDTISMDITLFDDLTYCAYGGMVKTDLPWFVELTPSVLLTLASYASGGWIWAAISFFVGRKVNIQTLCDNARVAMPNLTWEDVTTLAPGGGGFGSLVAAKKVWEWIQWAAWPIYCQCTPGTPDPVEPPTYVVPRPPHVGDGPLASYTCDNQDLCTQLQHLTAAVSALAGAQARLSTQVSLIQRQGVPFSYVDSTLHSALTGAGQFSVSDILALRVDLTAIPTEYAHISGDPDQYWGLGRITLGTADGWKHSVGLHHDPTLVEPISGDITLVAYDLSAGVVANIQTFQMEPAP